MRRTQRTRRWLMRELDRLGEARPRGLPEGRYILFAEPITGEGAEILKGYRGACPTTSSSRAL
jgi:hypothetical protein